jgi:hypothetical protein
MDPPGVMHFAVVTGEMHAEQMEMLALWVLVQHRTWTHGDARTKLYVMQFVFTHSHSLIKRIRLTQGGTVVDPHTGLDHSRSLIGRNCSSWVWGFTQLHEKYFKRQSNS